jgi:hypothetical protein
VPVVLATQVGLAGESRATRHFQREEMQFYPGENTHQSFRRSLFNGICGGCHGSVKGPELHVATNPDILTSASDVEALDGNKPPADLSVAVGNPQGPAFP